jgi:hypothetical protein
MGLKGPVGNGGPSYNGINAHQPMGLKDHQLMGFKAHNIMGLKAHHAIEYKAHQLRGLKAHHLMGPPDVCRHVWTRAMNLMAHFSQRC